MKKVLFAMMAAMTVFMVSCEPDNTVEIPTVSFAVQPVNTDGVFTLTLMTTGYNGTDPVTVPLTFSGNAEKGVDYSVSDEAFIIGGATPVTTITVTTLTTVNDKSVTAAISAPDGFQLGQLSSVTMALTPVTVYATFVTNTLSTISSATITIQTYGSNGEMKRMDRDLTIEVEVDPASTAVLGSNFEFVGGLQSIVVPAGNLEGTLDIRLLNYEEGKNTVILNIKPDDMVHIGDNRSITINFAGPIFEKLAGTWTMFDLVTDREYFESTYPADWGYSITYDGFPEFNSSDKFSIDIEAFEMTPEFQSSFNTYFKGVSNISDGGEYFIRTGMANEGFSLQLVNMDNINRYFSPTEISEDDESMIGIRFIEGENGEELLDMYLIDFIPHSFMKELNDGFTYDTENKPAAASTGCYFNMTFKRAE